MCAKKEEERPQRERIAIVDFPTFKKVSCDLIDAYDKGYVNFILSGPRITTRMPDTIEEMIKTKNHIDRKTFGQAIESFLFCMHYILAEEEEEELENLKETKDKKLADQLKEKLDFVNEILAKDPRVRNSFLTHTYSLSAILDKMEWEAKLKRAQSTEYGKTFSPYATGSIRLCLTTVGTRLSEFETNFVDFDVSLKDVQDMVRSLSELEEALKKLQAEKTS